MARYAKGANAERELIRILYEYGFAPIRAAGSGKSSLPSPDLIAIKDGRIIAFECKAWGGPYVNISHGQMDELSKWCSMAGAELIVAWKIPHKGWFLVEKNDMHKSGKAYIISEEVAMKRGFAPEVLAHKKLLCV